MVVNVVVITRKEYEGTMDKARSFFPEYRGLKERVNHIFLSAQNINFT
jgi:hypothetical protein